MHSRVGKVSNLDFPEIREPVFPPCRWNYQNLKANVVLAGPAAPRNPTNGPRSFAHCMTTRIAIGRPHAPKRKACRPHYLTPSFHNFHGFPLYTTSTAGEVATMGNVSEPGIASPKSQSRKIQGKEKGNLFLRMFHFPVCACCSGISPCQSVTWSQKRLPASSPVKQIDLPVPALH